MKKTKNLGIRPTGTTPLTGQVDGLEQSELSSSRGLHSPYITILVIAQWIYASH